MDIILEGISKSYGTHAVLRALSLRIPSGSVFGIMAPSGAGKTTLLRLIAGLERPDEGRILGADGRIAMVFQENRLLPWGTAAGNIRAFCPGLRREEILCALSDVGLEGCADLPVPSLSGGMARRVALLRALLSAWDILLLDEPFKGLDDDARQLAIDAVLRRRAGRTVLLVTHDLCEAQALGASVYRLPDLAREGGHSLA